MRLVTNSVQPNSVEETDFGWRINDVPIVKPMELAGGYVPRKSVKQTAQAWNGTPPTLNHPRNKQGEPISANQKPELQLGRNENASFDGEYVRTDIVVNEADLVRLGGEALDIRDALENGEPINVSSQYRGQELPPGEYDGEYRQNVERIVDPDSVAILPNKRGKCSVQDGCGINPEMVANAAVTLTATDDGVESSEGMADSMNANQMEFALTAVTPDDVDSYTDDEWDGDAATAAMPNPSDSEEAADALDAAHLIHPTTGENRDNKSNWKLPFRTGPDAAVNTRALVNAKARMGQTEATESDREGALARIDDFLSAAPDDLFGAGEGGKMSDNVLADIGRKVMTTLTGGSFEPATANNNPEDTVNREQLIDDITANSPLTEAALSERCDDGLEAIHSDIMANDNDDGGAGSGEEYIELTEEELMAKVEAKAEEKAEQMVANMQAKSEKEDLASDIVANSAEYEDTDAVLDDFPTTAALEAKRDTVQTSGSTMPGTGATANTEFETDDMDDISSGVIN